MYNDSSRGGFSPAAMDAKSPNENAFADMTARPAPSSPAISMKATAHADTSGLRITTSSVDLASSESVTCGTIDSVSKSKGLFREMVCSALSSIQLRISKKTQAQASVTK